MHCTTFIHTQRTIFTLTRIDIIALDYQGTKVQCLPNKKMAKGNMEETKLEQDRIIMRHTQAQNFNLEGTRPLVLCTGRFHVCSEPCSEKILKIMVTLRAGTRPRPEGMEAVACLLAASVTFPA